MVFYRRKHRGDDKYDVHLVPSEMIPTLIGQSSFQNSLLLSGMMGSTILLDTQNVSVSLLLSKDIKEAVLI